MVGSTRFQVYVWIVLVSLPIIVCFKFSGLNLRPNRLIRLSAFPISKLERTTKVPTEPAFTDRKIEKVVPVEQHGESGNAYWDHCTKDVHLDLTKPLAAVNQIGLHELRIRRFPYKKEEAWR